MSQHRKIYETEAEKEFSQAVCDVERNLADHSNFMSSKTERTILSKLGNNPSPSDMFDGLRVMALANPDSVEYASQYIDLLTKDDFANPDSSKGYRAVSEAYAYGLRSTLITGTESSLHQVAKNKITDLLENESLYPHGAKRLLGYVALESKKHNRDQDTKRYDIFGTKRTTEYPNQYPASPFLNDMTKFTDITDAVAAKHEHDQTYFDNVMERFSQTYANISGRVSKVLHLKPKSKNDNIIN